HVALGELQVTGLRVVVVVDADQQREAAPGVLRPAAGPVGEQQRQDHRRGDGEAVPGDAKDGCGSHWDFPANGNKAARINEAAPARPPFLDYFVITLIAPVSAQ